MRLRVAERLTAGEVDRLRLVARLARERGLTAWLVGGPVRDLLLARPSLDLDVTVEGDSLPLARSLAEALHGRLTVHERFGTACVTAGRLHLDVATARRETYACPGALPAVEPADLREDLRRRDLTFNALALRLDEGLETLYDPWGGYADLRRGLARGLHSATFRDDPTRLLRLARYSARYGCRVQEQTAEWAAAAVEGGALATISGQRVWLELQRLLAEATAPEACGLLRRSGVLARLGLVAAAPLRELYLAQRVLAALCSAEDRVAAALGLLAGSAAAECAARLGLSAREREGACAAASAVEEPPAAAFAGGAKNSTLYEALAPLPAAALLALWAARPLARANLERFRAVAGVAIDISGTTLQQAGYAPSPGFGPALQAARRARLDDHADREEQLRVALQVLTAWQRGRER